MPKASALPAPLLIGVIAGILPLLAQGIPGHHGRKPGPLAHFPGFRPVALPLDHPGSGVFGHPAQPSTAFAARALVVVIILNPAQPFMAFAARFLC